MRPTAVFAYAQARLQARFGERPDESVWLHLHGIGELGSYLQAAQQTSLRQWVLGLDPSRSSHEIELALRLKFRRHIDEVAGWMPERWRAALKWIKCLPDLPALQHLLAGGYAADWMQYDPALVDHTGENTMLRLQSAHQSNCIALPEGWRQGDPLFHGWLRRWRELLPKTGPATTEFGQGLSHIENLLIAQIAPSQNTYTPQLREELAVKLRTAFRRYRFQPATCCAYLALTALDIERLRGNLLQRALFSTACETGP